MTRPPRRWTLPSQRSPGGVRCRISTVQAFFVVTQKLHILTWQPCLAACMWTGHVFPLSAPSDELLCLPAGVCRCVIGEGGGVSCIPPLHMPLLFESNMCMLCCRAYAKWRASWFSLTMIPAVAGRLAMFGFSSALIGGGL